jgi:hypothetical protein
MRGFAAFVGVMMIIFGVTLALIGAFWAMATQSRAHGEAYRTGWVCGPYFAQDAGPDQHPCRVTGISSAEQAADSAAGMAWVATGGALTVGGALLSGALIMSAGRREPLHQHQAQPVQGQQPVQQMPQQQHMSQPLQGSFAPQPNYGQPPRPQ